MRKLKLRLLVTTITSLFALSPVFADNFADNFPPVHYSTSSSAASAADGSAATDSSDDEGGGNEAARNKIQFYRLSDSVDLVTKSTSQYASPKIVVKSVYPELQSDDVTNVSIDHFDNAVVDLVQASIDDFKMRVKQNQPSDKNAPKQKGTNDFYVDYDTSSIKSDGNDIVSIRFTTQGYITGTAHPYHNHFVFNYDLGNNQQLELNDLFLPDTNYLEALSNYTSQALGKHLSNKDFIAIGTAPTVENFKNWNIKPDGILITFDEAQVAPYVFGAQTVLVPYSALKKIISPDSPIIGCVNHSKTCANNTLLTGSFIEEAVNTFHSILDPVLSFA